MIGAIPSVLLQDGGGGGAGIVVLLFFLVFVVVFALLPIAGLWKIFTKAGEPGWAAIIPIYNVYLMLKIGDNEWWWLLVLFVPIVQLYASFKIFNGVSKAFGRGVGFTLGMWFLSFIFLPLLGFGDYHYQGVGGGRAPQGQPAGQGQQRR